MRSGICPEFVEWDRAGWTLAIWICLAIEVSPRRTGPFKITKRIHDGLINWHCWLMACTPGVHVTCLVPIIRQLPMDIRHHPPSLISLMAWRIWSRTILDIAPIADKYNSTSMEGICALWFHMGTITKSDYCTDLLKDYCSRNNISLPNSDKRPPWLNDDISLLETLAAQFNALSGLHTAELLALEWLSSGLDLSWIRILKNN